MRYDLTIWTAGDRVEAYHPGHGERGWAVATVVSQVGKYVTILWDDGVEATTHHLNVRVPGAPDPLLRSG